MSPGIESRAAGTQKFAPSFLRLAERGVNCVLCLALLVTAPIPVILLTRAAWLELSKLTVYQLIDLL